MTRASRGQLVSVNEKSTVGITGIIREHSVVDILLGTFGAIARSQESAGRVRGQASFQSSSLSVVVMSIAVILGNVLQNDSPEPFNVQSTMDLDIIDLTGAKVAFRSDPVTGVIRTGSFGSSSIVVVVEAGFLWGDDDINQIIGRLISDISVLFQEDGILADFVSDFVVGIFWIFNAERHISVDSTSWRSFGITVAMMNRWRMMRCMMWHWMMGYMRYMGMAGEGQSQGEHQGSSLQKLCFKIQFLIIQIVISTYKSGHHGEFIN